METEAIWKYKILINTYVSFTNPYSISYLGIPCWLVHDTNPEKNIEEVISNHLQTNPALLDAVSKVEASLKEVIVESSEVYSIIKVPPVRKEKNVSKTFIISDVLENQGTIVQDRIEELQVFQDSRNGKIRYPLYFFSQ